jgi:hypothetical protein
MPTASSPPLDFVHELRLRRWARENYVPPADRDRDWPGVVHEEMCQRDRELEAVSHYAGMGRRIVPLVPDGNWTIHGAHLETSRSRVLASIPVVRS